MEENNDFEVLQGQIKDNINDWYDFEKDKKYIVLEDFSKDKIYELEKSANQLMDNDKILIILENELSIKSICKNVENKNNLFNRREIEELLDKNGLIYRKFYYPLPDYKMTNVIFTDNHLPNSETISRNIVFYKENDIKKNDERQELVKMMKQDVNLFKIFANSFFIECSKKQFEDNGIEFVSFSNMRKQEYRIKTIIKGDNVYKKAANSESITHIEQIKKNIEIIKEVKLNTLDSYDENTIISKYQKGKETFDKIIVNELKNKEIEKVNQLICNLFKELKEKLIIVQPKKNVFDKFGIQYEKQDIQNLTFVKYGLWDLIFQNIFFIDNKYFFFDQEWMEAYNKQLRDLIDIGQIYNKFGIKKENVELFNKLDNELQLKTRSELSWKLHTQLFDITNEDKFIKILENNKRRTTQEFKSLLNEKDARIKFLEDNMEQTCNLLREKEQELDYMKNSASWKITKPLRKIRGQIKKG